MCRLPSGLWSPIPSIRSAIASLRRAARLLFDRCATAPETRPLPAVSCAHPPATSTDCPAVSDGRGEAVIPRPVVRGPDSRCTSPVALPPYPPPIVLSAQLPAMLIVRRRDGVPSSAGTAPGPADDRPSTLCAPTGDPTSLNQVKVRTRAKSITGFSLYKPVPGFKTGYWFTGSRLTSLRSCYTHKMTIIS